MTPENICEYVVANLVKLNKLPAFVGVDKVEFNHKINMWELRLYDAKVDDYLNDLQQQYKQQNMQWPKSLEDQRYCRVMLEVAYFEEERYYRDDYFKVPDDAKLVEKSIMRVAHQIMYDYKTWRNNYWKHVK